ncbi:MAG: DUF3826 domain-containing protein [Bacteroidetes bacterium]|nr:DUF3826 domain-containing protein [Bacteroidota bacterium]
MKKCLLALGSTLLLTFSFGGVHATIQGVRPAGNEDTAYIRVVTERAGKIVATLGLPDSAQFFKVRKLVADQYFNLNTIYTERDERLKQLKGQQPALDKNVQDSLKKQVQQDVDAKVTKLHEDYLRQLSAALNGQQVDQVKDGMTYGVLQVTYRGYQEELPNLTTDQKDYILAALTEAREHAMDGGTSQEKHAWFGKYKGRINNYLSAQGYDMKKAGEEWQKRRQQGSGASNGATK